MGTRPFKCIAFLAVLLSAIVGCSSSSDQPPVVQPASVLLSPDAFAEAISTDDRFVLNVHTPDEGSIAGTDAAVAYDQLAAKSGQLPDVSSTPLAVYCRSGNMSATAVVQLHDMGYEDIVELEGGMETWQESGRNLVESDT